MCNNRRRRDGILCYIMIVVVAVFSVENRLCFVLKGISFVAIFLENCVFILSIIKALIMFKISYF